MGIKTIVRYAWADQYPKGTDLRNAARDSVIRYALHFDLTFRWYHDQAGERWKWSPQHRRYIPTRVYGWRSEAIVVEPAPEGGPR